MSKQANKPFCKVCKDAGKSESDYTSHWVRTLPDRSGKTKITCPTLLSTECRYCFCMGHTAKFCPVIKENDKKKKREDIQEKKEVITKKVITKKTPTSMFAAFADDSSSDSEPEVVVSKKMPNKPHKIEEFPALLASSSKTQLAVHMPSVKPEAKSGWAAALAKPKPVEQDQFIAKIEERSMIKNLPQSALRPKQLPGSEYSKQIYSKPWEGWSDSDESEDETAAEQVYPDYDSDW